VPDLLLSDLLSAATAIFEKEPMVLKIKRQIVVVGDLHGHLLDLCRILEEFGYPPYTRYLFLGDIVDRGEFSTETTILILTMKVLWPDCVFLIRGNHEFPEMWASGGFAREVEELYPSTKILDQFEKCFSFVPIAAIVNDSIFCVHGGIGWSFSKVSTLAKLDRPIHDFESHIVGDALWSDPCAISDGFFHSDRGIGCLYGELEVASFLSENNLSLIVRGHEVVEEGIRWDLNKQVATVFSASGYCNGFTNGAAVLILNTNCRCKVHKFEPLKYVYRNEVRFADSIPPTVLSTKKTSQRSTARRSSIGRTNEMIVKPIVHRMNSPGHIFRKSTPPPLPRMNWGIVGMRNM
jgi:protein phosphatase